MTSLAPRDQAGYTLLELIMAATIIGILALIVSEFYVSRLIDYARNETIIVLQTNTKQALTSLERDTKSAQAVLATNQWPDPNGPSGNQFGWTSTTGSPSVLVLAVPARTTTNALIYTDANTHAALQTDNVIYYVDSAKKTLYRRVIANPVSGNSAKTTCPPAIANASCPPDAKIIEDVANLQVTYFDSNDAATASVGSAYSLNATLTQSRAKYGRTFTNSLTSRASLRNKP